MKKLFLFAFLCFLNSIYIFGQKQYTVNGETLLLKTEVEGNLDLLLLEQEKGYRFFIQDSNGNIAELVTTKDLDGTYFGEFRDTLEAFTKDSNMSAREVGFNKYSIKKYVIAYNKQGARRYAYTDEKVTAQARLGIFGGITNHPLVFNPNNISTAYGDVEFEVFEKKERPRQSGFISLEQTFKNQDFDYTSTIIALGHRFRFINKSRVAVYTNFQFATYTFSKYTMATENSEATERSNAFRVPLILGLGTDIRISDTSYISVIYNEIYAILVKNNGNVPVNISLGYKFNL